MRVLLGMFCGANQRTQPPALCSRSRAISLSMAFVSRSIPWFFSGRGLEERDALARLTGRCPTERSARLLAG